MDQVFHIFSKNINIDGDRERYTKLYDFVRKRILDGLKQNEEFKALFCCEKLCGSYADNLKISKPDEFDLVMRFEFPSKDYIEITHDDENKGNVLINLALVLISLRRDIPKDNNMYIFLTKIVDCDGYLLENKFQQWLQSLMTSVSKKNQMFVFENLEYNLGYRREGPAHTIFVQSTTEKIPKFSIDFVPGFVFGIDKSVSSRTPNAEYWEAIPRHLKNVPLNRTNNNSSFRTSYTDSERKLITSKYQLKNALKLTKRFRDLHPNMKHLKSYYIKTIFLWMDEECGDFIWRNPILEIMLMVFKRVEDCLLNKEIKFFWEDDLNMLLTVKTSQILEMQRDVSRARKILEKGKRREVLKLFLSDEERANLTESEMKIISDNLKMSKLNTLFSCFKIS